MVESSMDSLTYNEGGPVLVQNILIYIFYICIVVELLQIWTSLTITRQHMTAKPKLLSLLTPIVYYIWFAIFTVAFCSDRVGWTGTEIEAVRSTSFHVGKEEHEVEFNWIPLIT